MITKQDIQEMIMDYNWMINLLINNYKDQVESSRGLTAIYGVEATLPKAKGVNTDPVYQEILRIEEFDKSNKKIKEKVMFVQKHSKSITDIKDKIILNRLLDGKSLRDIAEEMKMSISGINYRKEMIIDTMYKSYLSEQKEQTVK